MRAPLRRGAALLVGAVLAGASFAALAATQLHKCVEGGRTVYQQQACSPSAAAEAEASAAQVASTPATAKTAAPAGAPASAPNKLRAPTSPASAAPATPR